jgi:flagellar biogenesis protein FliO
MEAVHSNSRAVQPASLMSRFLAPVLAVLRSISIHRRERSLRLCETLPLGEKRLLAVVQFDRQRFLIGATSQSVSLLQRLDDFPNLPNVDFASVRNARSEENTGCR